MTYHEKSSTETSPLNRALPGYDTEDTVALLYEAAVRKTFEEMETDWHRNDHDLQTLVVPLAENCYYSEMYSCAIRGKENIEWVEVSEEETIDLDELEDMFPDDFCGV